MKGPEEYRKLAEDVVAAQTGDREALERIIAAVRDAVYYTCLKMLRSEDRALDATQEITMTVFERIGELRDPNTYVGWVNRITANHCRNLLTRKNREFLVSDNEEESDPFASFASLDEQTLPELVLEKNETMRMVRELIDSLPDEQRMCVVLYYFNQMKTREIADALRVSEGTVKSRLNYARKTLRDSVERYEKKGLKLRVLLAMPFLGKLFGALKVSAAAAGFTATAATGYSVLQSAGTKIAAGLVAAMLIGTTGAVAVNRSETRETKCTKETRRETIVCETVIEEDFCVPCVTRVNEPIVLEEETVAAEALPVPQPSETPTVVRTAEPAVEAIASEPAPAPEPAPKPEPAPEPEPASEPEPAQAELPCEAPEAQVPEEQSQAGREYVFGNEDEEPHTGAQAEIPSAFAEPTESNPAWSEWSLEAPTGYTEVRTKIQYRCRIIRMESHRGEGFGAETAADWSEWSDEAIEPFESEGVWIAVEIRTVYSWR